MERGEPSPYRRRPRAATALALVRGRTAWRLGALAVLVLWGAVVAAVLPAALGLGAVETASFSALLPVGAPSTVALGLLRRVEGRNESELLVVCRADGSRPAAPGRLVAAATGLERAVRRAGGPGLAPAGPPTVAPDGRVALVPFSVTGDERGVMAAVRQARHALEAHPVPGVTAGVTGPAAFETDLLGSLAGVDTTLVLVTAALVGVLFVVTYRSPTAWALPLVAVAIAEVVANAATSLVAHAVPVSGESTGLLTVLVFGVGTDDALLLTARYREELHGPLGRSSDHHALWVAWRRAAPAVAASATTVVAALACLLLADSGVARGFAVVGMVGVAVTATVLLTAYPAMLVLSGRGVFWPRVPRGVSAAGAFSGAWRTVASVVVRHPRAIWTGGVALIVVLAAGLHVLDTQVTAVDDLPAGAPSVRAMDLLSGSVPLGVVAPAVVVVRAPAALAPARRVAAETVSVVSVGPSVRSGRLAAFDVVFRPAPLGAAGLRPVEVLRAGLARAVGTSALVGGQSAEDVDARAAARRDLLVVGPAVLAVAVAVLALVLRALAGPVLVAATIAASYLAVLGGTAALSRSVFRWPGIDPTVPLLGFVLLVALGVDYTIFLMARAREELVRDRGAGSASPGPGAASSMERTVAATGGVLTAAGLILAGTFSALLVLPLLPIRQIGLVVAGGVLFDALLVRSVLLPAIVVDTGRGFWWPTRLGPPVGASPPGTGSRPEGAVSGEGGAAGGDRGAAVDGAVAGSDHERSP